MRKLSILLIPIPLALLITGSRPSSAAAARPSPAANRGDHRASVRLTGIRVDPVTIHPNLIANAGFEEAGADGLPTGWRWDRRNTDATFEIVGDGAHGGRRCARITNGTPFGAHVYAMLWQADPVRIEAGKPYTMSAWVRSEEPGSLGLLGGDGWQFRAYAPATGGRWRRIHTTFVPNDGSRDFVVRVSTESPTKGVWIDDLKLEEGPGPTPVVPESESNPPLQLTAAMPESEAQGDGAFRLSFILYTPRSLEGEAIAEIVNDPIRGQKVTKPPVKARGSSRSRGESRAPIRLKPGAWRITVGGTSAAAPDTPVKVRLRLVAGGREAARVGARLRIYSALNVLGRLAVLRRRLPAMKRRIDALERRGGDVSYPLVTYTILDNFTGYAAEDARKGEVKRALAQAGDLEQMTARLESELRGAESGRRRLPAVPRWTGARRPIIRGGSFYAPAAAANRDGSRRKAPVSRPALSRNERKGSRFAGAAALSPVFFTGYGAFGQVRADIEKFPAYGVNLVQVEFGPNSVFPKDGAASDAPVREMRRLLDRAKKAGVAVNLLISPHYMPAWMLEKHPEMRRRREGFIQYCIHAPEGWDLLRRFARIALTPLKDHPALHSVCLSNEPVNVEEPCEYAANDWRAWLRRRHGDVTTLNARWGTDYRSFDDIALPDPFAPRPATSVWMEYVRFNQEDFAAWHRMLADAVRAAAPGVPVHAKAMTWTMLNDTDVRYGVDAALFGGFSQINGNDAVNWYSFGSGEFAQGWQANAMGHDLQRSVLDAPVFNSENHLITDRDTRDVPAAHIRAALWQAAIHGQGATAIWVWERAFDPKSDFYASIMHRPACAAAVGIVNHDLNRAAREVSAIQGAPPSVLLPSSVAASVWDAGRYSDSMGKLYTALSFTGAKIGLVTERQLEDGVLPKAPVILVPAVSHLSEAAFAALKRYPGRIVCAGEDDPFAFDDYGRPRTDRMRVERLPYRYGPTGWRDLWGPILERLPRWGVAPAITARGADGRPAWGVEWRAAESRNGAVVNLCNYRQAPVRVALYRGGRPARVTDVLTGERLSSVFPLKPLETRLVRLAPVRGR